MQQFSFGWPVLFVLVLVAACNRPAPSSLDDHVDTVSMARAMEKDSASIDTGIRDIDVQQVASWLREDLLKEDLNFLKPGERRFSLDTFDLNEDGIGEFFIGFTNDYFCGSGGCTYYIVDASGSVHARFTVSYAPFRVLPSKTNGWHDLWIDSSTGTHWLRYDGSSYPSNPSMLPVVPVDSLSKGDFIATVLPSGRPVYRF